MRLYSFVNFYLSSIQQGIQTGHLSDNITVKYQLDNAQNGATPHEAWIRNHKTYYVMNGLDLKNIKSIYALLETYCPQLNLPFDKFHEDEDSLGGIMTCCGVVVPETFYDAVRIQRDDGTYDFVYNTPCFTFRYEYETPEWYIIDLIKKYRFAS